MAMSDKISINIQANLAAGASKQLQKELDILAKSLKLNISNVNLAGQELTKSTQKVKKELSESDKAIKNMESSMTRLAQQYRAMEITAKQFMESGKKIKENEMYSETSLAKRAALMRALNAASKDYETSLKAQNQMAEAVARSQTRIASSARTTTGTYRVATGGDPNSLLNTQASMIRRQTATIEAEANRWGNLIGGAVQNGVNRNINSLQNQAANIRRQTTLIDSEATRWGDLIGNSIREGVSRGASSLEQRTRDIRNASQRELQIARETQRQLNLIRNSQGASSRVTLYDSIQASQVQSSLSNQLAAQQSRLSSIPVTSANSAQIRAMTEEMNRLSVSSSRVMNSGMLNQWNGQLSNARMQINQLSRATAEAASSTRGFTADIIHNLGKMVMWTIAGTALFGTLNEIKKGITFINNMNKSMTNVAMITGRSREEINAMTADYAKLATQLHETTSSAMKASEEFLRAGNTHEETMQLIQASTLMSKIAGQDQKSSADQLIAITNAYKLSAEQTIQVVDQLTTVDNASATSTAELGTAIQRTASSAQLAKVSFTDLVSYIATVSSVSRKSASSIGESFKTIFARFQDVKGGKLFDAENDDISNVERDFAKYADIHIRKTSGEFKEFSTVIEELAKKWDTLSEVEQNATTKALAGVRQRESLLILMNNMTMALGLQEKQLNATGSAQKRYEEFAVSTEARLNDLTNTIQTKWMNALDSDTINGFIGGLAFLIKTFGDVKTIIGVVAIAILYFTGTAITGAIAGIGTFIGSLYTLATATTVTSAGVTTLKIAFDQLKIAFLSNPIGIVAVALGVLAGAFMFATAKANENREATLKALQAEHEHQKEIKELTEKYKILSQTVGDNETAKAELAAVEEQLRQKIGQGTIALDLQSGAIDRNIQKIKELSRAQIDEKLATQKLQYDQAKAWLQPQSVIYGKGAANAKPETVDEILARLKKQVDDDNAEGSTGFFSGLARQSHLDAYNDYKKKVEENRDIVKQYETLQALNNPSYFPAHDYSPVPYNPSSLNETTSSNYDDVPSYIPPNDDSSKKSSGSISAESDIPEKIILKDRYAKINIELQKYNNLIEENKALQENASIEEKNKLLTKQIDNYKLLQDATHRKANETRLERDELVRSLMSKGFGFTGSGENLNITNAESVLQSKLNQVNSHRADKNKTYYNQIKSEYDDMLESFNRFYDIQTKDIPALQREWLGYKKEIAETGNAIEKNIEDQINLKFSKFDESLDELKSKKQDLDYAFKSLGDNEFDAKTKNIGEQSKLTTEEIKRLEEELFVLQSTMPTNEKQAALYTKRIKELTTQVKEGKLTLVEFNEKLVEIGTNKAKAGQDAIDSYISYISDKVKEKISSIEDEKDAADKASKLIIEGYQAQIDALEDKSKLEDEEIDRKKKLLDISKAQEELDNARKEKNVRVYHAGQGFIWEASAKDVREKTENLEKLQTDYNEWSRDVLVDHQKRTLQDKIDAEKKSLEATKNAYDENIKSISRKMSDLEKNVKDTTLNQIKSWDALQSKLQQLGVEAPKQLEIIRKAVEAMNTISSGIGVSVPVTPTSTPNAGTPWGNATNSQVKTVVDVISGKTTNPKATAEEIRNLKDMVNAGVASGADIARLKSLTGGFADGGEVSKTGLALVHGSVNKPERILSSQQTSSFNKLVNFLPNFTSIIDRISNGFNMPNLATSTNGSSGGDTIYDFHDFVIQSNDVKSFIEQMKRKIRSS